MPIVKVVVINDDPGLTALSGATVYFYNTTGVLQTSAVTNNSGIATVTLPNATYDIYVFLESFSCLQPQRIVVADPPPNNDFQISGHLKTLPEAQDPKLCRVSGKIITFTGVPAKSVELTMVQVPKNIIVSKKLSFYRPVQIKSDNNGYFEFDLIRNVKYKIDYQNYDGEELIAKAPNRPAVTVTDLLFPIPIFVDLSQTTLSLSQNSGINDSVTYIINYSDGNTDPTPHEWASIRINNSNSNVAQVSAFQGRLQISPITTGTSVITFSRIISDEYVWIDPPPFTSENLTITVT